MKLGQLFQMINDDEFANFVENVNHETDPAVLSVLGQKATRPGRVKFLEYLVGVGYDINDLNGVFEANALAYAAAENSLESARFLYDHGARILTETLMGNPLILAAMRGHLEVVKWLVEIGADPHLTYQLGSGALDNAYAITVSNGHEEVAEFLATLGCRLPLEGDRQNAIEAERSDEDGSETQAEDVSTTAEAVRSYLQGKLGPVDKLSAHEIFSPLGNSAVSVNFIQPNTNHNDLTLFSTGPSNQALETPEGKEDFQYAEFVMHLPPDWPHPREADPEWQWPVSYFKQIAYFGLLKDTWLSDNGKIIVMAHEDDWPQSADLSEVLLMPDIIPPLQADRLIRFYSIIPLTPQVHALGSEGGPPRIREAIESGELDITSAWTGLLKK